MHVMRTDQGMTLQGESSALPPATGSSKLNVGKTERIISVIGGVALGAFGIRNIKTRSGKAMALASLFLLKRGTTGYCEVNSLLHRNTAGRKASAMEVTGTFTINKPRSEVYAFWRNLENLPKFMKHLDEVKVIDERRSQWKARVPGGVGTISWEAVLQEEGENNYLSWSSLPGSTIDNAGEVQFKDAPGNRGTEIRASISYRLPAGDLGSLAGKLINPVVEQLVKEDLRRFKNIMETGEIPTVEGQPSGRSTDTAKAKKTEAEQTQENKGVQNYESSVLERH